MGPSKCIRARQPLELRVKVRNWLWILSRPCPLVAFRSCVAWFCALRRRVPRWKRGSERQRRLRLLYKQSFASCSLRKISRFDLFAGKLLSARETRTGRPVAARSGPTVRAEPLRFQESTFVSPVTIAELPALVWVVSDSRRLVLCDHGDRRRHRARSKGLIRRDALNSGLFNRCSPASDRSYSTFSRNCARFAQFGRFSRGDKLGVSVPCASRRFAHSLKSFIRLIGKNVNSKCSMTDKYYVRMNRFLRKEKYACGSDRIFKPEVYHGMGRQSARLVEHR